MISIRRTGCDGAHPAGFCIERPRGYDCWLLLLVKTEAWFSFQGQLVYTAPGTAVLFPPQAPHRYGALGLSYVNDWVQFEIDAGILDGFDVPENRPLPIADPEALYALFRLFTEAWFSASPSRDRLAAHFLSIILLKLGDGASLQTGPRSPDLVRLRRDVWSNPHYDWSVPRMASRLGVSEGHLQHLYRERFSISCAADVIASRIARAKELLSETSLSVKQVAFASGYRNDVHFIRQFGKWAGMTPLEYRRGISPL